MEQTINDVFKNRAIKYKKRIAIEKKFKGKWESATWEEYYNQSRHTGLSLYSLGINKGDKVSILAENRLEWLFSDMGTLGAGGCIIPIYPTLTKEDVAYIVENSESKIIIVENSNQLIKALYALNHCKCLDKIIVMNAEDIKEDHTSIMSFKNLLDAGKKLHESNQELFENLSKAVTPDDIATIVYTSGTTGTPKGAMITHKNIMAVIKSLAQIKPPYAYDSDQTVPFLPLSHVFERVAGHFFGMYIGITSSYAESIETLLADLKEKKPTIVLAVPRVLEKVYQKIMSQVDNQPLWKRIIFSLGQNLGNKISEYRESKQSIPVVFKLLHAAAYILIFKKLQEGLGGRVRWITASGAPTANDIIRFFNAAGIMVIEGYGMTECVAPATMSRIDHYKIGTAGPPIPGMEMKIAEDGEILIRGENLFKGYFKMEEETKRAFTEDGFFMTGDVGKFDKDRFLAITDRKKDLIITSGGKNVAPQKIENLFKTNPIFSQFIVIGDKKKYLSAICNINLEEAAKLAIKNNIAFESPLDLLNNEKFNKALEKIISEMNTKLAKYETIKRFKIINQEFSQDTGELTPSLKVKRKVVHTKYRDIIDSMYEN
ncbi:MAG: long-chain fatty acid--CoA ligase [Desulfobacterales bacterium]|nr:long-chain fatty acid--CoA ligase [Desulfobacterales bacterium]